MEIDFRTQDGDLIVSHDARSLEGALLLRDALEVVRQVPPGPTVLMLDAKDDAPWTEAEVRRIASLIHALKFEEPRRFSAADDRSGSMST